MERDEHSASDRVKLLKHKRGAFAKVLQIEIDRAHRYTRLLSLGVICARRAPYSSDETWSIQRPILFQTVAASATQVFRSPDFFAKVSEAAFAVGLPETDLKGARIAMDRLVEAKTITDTVARMPGGLLGFSSAAITLRRGEKSANDFIERALAALDQKLEKDALLV